MPHIKWFSFNIHSPNIDWQTEIYKRKSDCKSDMILALIQFTYNKYIGSSTCEYYDISLEMLYELYNNDIGNFDNVRLAPFYVTPDEWYIAVITFGVENNDECIYRHILLSSVNGYGIVEYTKSQCRIDNVWVIGDYKFRVNHILIGINRYIPTIKIDY